MSQFARPESDAEIGLWEDDGGGTTNLFEAINEQVANDADFIRCETLEGGFDSIGSSYVAKLSAIDDPGTDLGFKIRLHAAQNLPNANVTSFIIELRQDYVDELQLGILIASRLFGPLTDTVAEFSFDLTEGEAILIDKFDSLFYRIRFGVF